MPYGTHVIRYYYILQDHVPYTEPTRSRNSPTGAISARDVPTTNVILSMRRGIYAE